MTNETEIPTKRSAYPVVTPVTLRFSDQDPLGHINNVAVTAILESGRTGLLRVLFDGVELPPRSMVLANLVVDYRHEMTFPGTVEVGAKLVHVGTKSLRGAYAIFQNGVCCVTSHSTNVFFDNETRKSKMPPSSVHEQLKRILAEHTL
ncbi:acyl-CoA thioesterase [Pseudahrensia aquimaris]|uniref:Acyl-CoA thioesterase n=1 Tax=Pseudahrensia aquimaris TaxID=744461 RepID=A0ABW3FBB2_9HYPH